MQSSEDPAEYQPSISQWQVGVEELDRYRPAGYHPVHIGGRYHDRYEVVHKIRDYLAAKNVALKVLVAAAKESLESNILHTLSRGKETQQGRPYVSSLLDEFTIDGPNGRHLYLISEAAGCSIAQPKEASTTWMFPVNVARAIAAQTLLGLDYIHSCQVVHGDLHSNNILFRMPSIEQLSIDGLYSKLGAPQKLPVERLDKGSNGPGVPSYCVSPGMIFESSEDIINPQILISDFGESFFKDTETRTGLHTPILLLPPELFFHERLTQAVDVWTLRYTLYEIQGERPLFESFMPDEAHVIAEMISTLGPLPQKWWDKWNQRADLFLKNKSWDIDTKRSHAPYPRPLNERLRIMGRGEDPATCEPSSSITTSTAIKSAWIEGWGWPAQREVSIKPAE
ncbi:kinase-like domain-containing protein [Aspergillus pseudoustus]|uniref:non-specific serine/threonine protein kinase n=1 Tax=Aspergillus pseudoustus TaxID=1810923 RepID=A0ABR4JJ26_9EURO